MPVSSQCGFPSRTVVSKNASEAISAQPNKNKRKLKIRKKKKHSHKKKKKKF